VVDLRQWWGARARGAGAQKESTKKYPQIGEDLGAEGGKRAI